MELDELKENWKKIGHQQAPFNTQRIREMMQNSSQSPLVKLRKSMFLEGFIMFALVGLLYALYMLDSFNSSQLALFGLGLFTALWVLFCIYFYSRIYKTSSFPENVTIKESISQKIATLESDINFYKNINLIFYLPAFFIGILMGNKALTSFEIIFNSEWRAWLVIVLLAILLYPLYYVFVKFWVQKFYGKFLDELKEMEDEILTMETEME